MRSLIILLCFTFVVSCDSNSLIENDCLSSKLDLLEMVEFTGQELDCQFYVEMIVFAGEQYFHIDSHCADVAANLQDCYGQEYCVEETSVLCSKIYAEGENKGIVGFLQ